MTVSNARNSLIVARRELADAIDKLPRSILAMRSRSKRGKIKRAILHVDRSMQELRGL